MVALLWLWRASVISNVPSQAVEDAMQSLELSFRELEDAAEQLSSAIIERERFASKQRLQPRPLIGD